MAPATIPSRRDLLEALAGPGNSDPASRELARRVMIAERDAGAGPVHSFRSTTGNGSRSDGAGITKATTIGELAFSFPILGKRHTPEGDLIVYGRATDGTVDNDQQIVDPVWSGKALQEWLATGGNVRVQHNPGLYPAGRGLEVEVDKGDGGHWVKALVVEDTAKRLVEKGVLRAFSVGIMLPQIVRDATARAGRVVGGQIAEISLVDRPANKNCAFQLAKSVGGAAAPVGVMRYGAEDAAVRRALYRVLDHSDPRGWIS
jgi:hypothetical protein